ncbi:hypothetical protein [Kutzneria albida]|uniref:Uncharacterized protein n=1 Tax=Kutzneria albida DSM 43870 TaxID=1449976 RepID=W5VZD5_9PSEU|nr:hypothetical protein [Kutzneria albida]AHH93835.1 hypothetical protein KALB_459 [Kutzneria albida DSM 43870]
MSTPGADQGAGNTANYAQQQFSKENGADIFGFGAMITAMEGVAAAATAGSFAVDGNTAELINSKLSDIQNAVSAARATMANMQAATPLGQGYAQQIGNRNTQIAVGGSGSAEETLAKFEQSLDELKRTIQTSVNNYHGADQAGKHRVDGSGSYA